MMDGVWLFGALEAFARRSGGARQRLEYAPLVALLRTEVIAPENSGAAKFWLAAAVDERNESQRKFAFALKSAGIDVAPVDYRRAIVVAASSAGTGAEAQASSLASLIGFNLGRLSRRNLAELVIVSGSFEHAAALQAFRNYSPRTRISVAYFGSLLDRRWFQFGLFDGSENPIRWFDLEPHAKAIGLDLPVATGPGAPATADDLFA
ncbi:MAG: hypothetical protein FJ100_15160 [Deltaproteobacteria bacterium]|nr:hypothetical protein [Deltaproteobacteria bacterium]